MDVHSHETGVQRHDQHVVFIGRDDPRKGLAVLLESWPAVRGRFVDAELGIVGVTGTDRSGVHFHGRVSEERKRELLGTAAILVAPNLGGESFGLVVTEAMASGCAVVASDLAAFRWVTGGTALLFPPGDVRGLSARLIELLNQPEVVAAMGRRGRALAAKYDWSVVLPSYRAAYRDAVGMGPPPR
jgi:phosphatidylinositol alpha-mannosyltransferase